MWPSWSRSGCRYAYPPLHLPLSNRKKILSLSRINVSYPYVDDYYAPISYELSFVIQTNRSRFFIEFTRNVTIILRIPYFRYYISCIFEDLDYSISETLDSTRSISTSKTLDSIHSVSEDFSDLFGNFRFDSIYFHFENFKFDSFGF